MGVYTGTSKEFNQIIDDLRAVFLGNSYNIITRNCNHFSEALVQRLVGRPIPAFINRLAYFGSLCTCLLPQSMLGSAPVDGQSSSAISSGRGGSGGGSKATAFSGKGYKLGSSSGESQDQASERLLSSSDDSRAKAREAALLRLSQRS
jgi:hypothetical protein